VSALEEVMQTIGGILTFLAACYLVYLVFNYGLNISQYGFKGAITAVVIAIGVLLLLTREKSPVFIVPIVDTSVEQVDKALGDSYTAKRVEELFGQSSGSIFGGNTSASGGDQSGGGSQSGGGGDQSGGGSQSGGGGDQSGGGVAGKTFPFNASLTENAQGLNRSTNVFETLANPISVCGYAQENPGNLLTCDGHLVGAHLVINTWDMPSAPNTASADNGGGGGNQTATGPTKISNEAMANCWTTWAGVYLYGTDQDWGQNALPVGYGPWALTGPGGFADFGSWAGVQNEKWTLSNRQLGIVDFPVNGVVGRSFPRFDDSGSVTVYGSNSNIPSECIALAP